MHASCRLPCFLSVCSLPCLLIQAAELQLVHEPQGTFIIRPSSQADQLSLTVRSPPSPSAFYLDCGLERWLGVLQDEWKARH
eukprot:m.75024 g.75024  ORF g.75024 m.75024 type:complete len:82 (-) comp14391_c0_seq2:149-394(-)